MELATHYATLTLATQGMVNKIRDVMIDHPELNAWIYLYTNDKDAQLVYTNSSTAAASLGERWHWSRTLADMDDLQTIFPPDK